MLSVLISFVYIGLTGFFLGFGVRLGVKKYLHYEIQKITGLLMAGLGTATVYAGFFSLFGGVGLGANVGLVLICLCILLVGRKELSCFLKKIKSGLTPAACLLVMAAILVMAYGTSRGYLHFDTGLYHAQSIRWIEEYGTVYGLANLHSRLAYNSSAFCLTALYSGAFLTGQSLHTVSGFLALVMAVKGFSVVRIFRTKTVIWSDFMKIALLWYISIIYMEMMSPSSDYFAMLFLFYIVLTWLELIERKEKDITPFCLLLVLLAVTVTIKLSVAIMLILILKPAVVLIRERQYLRIAGYLALGLLAIFPYLARNVVLSGWLIYPFGGIDWFAVDWKLPLGEVLYDAEEIKVYAKGMRDVLLKDTPLWIWLPDWFGSLKELEKVWVTASLLSLFAGGIWIVCAVLKKEKEMGDIVFLELTLMVGYLFWQLGTPLVRYGYLYILVFPFFTASLWYCRLLNEKRIGWRLMAAFLIFLGVYKGFSLSGYILRYSGKEHYIWQQDYYTGAYDSYKLGEVTIYIPLESGQIGYDKFPSSPYVREDVELRDGTLKGGFRRK